MNAFPARLGLLAVLLWLLPCPTALRAAATGQPVAIKDLCLLLRGGYTDDEILRETAGRPLLQPLDAEGERTLQAAGADARLIAALKSSHPALSADEAAAARQRQAEVDERTRAGLESQRASLLAFHKQAAESHQTAILHAAFGRCAEQLRGALVTLKDDSLQPYPESTLAGKKLFAFYFASLTAPGCQKFTPQLVKFYQDYAPKHPEFEVVFISLDMSGYNMENHMRQDAMPWPALAFDHRADQAGLVNLGREAMPRLVLINGMDQVVSDSVVDGKNLGPQHVLDDLLHPPAPGSAPAGTPSGAVGGGGAGGDPNHMASLLHGKLVTFSNDAWQSYDDSKLAGKKYFGLYYSASWCGPCKQFTPQLVDFYKRNAAAHPNFEIVFISDDHSALDMQNYMKMDGMPWAAVRFERKGEEKELLHYAGSGIPDLVVVEGNGTVVSDSFEGKQYVGPQKVMNDLHNLIAQGD